MQRPSQVFAAVARRLSSKLSHPSRNLSVSPAVQAPGRWFGRLFNRSQADATGPHAASLSETHHVYEMQIHCVQPRFMEEYLKQYAAFVSMINVKKTGAELVGSFFVEVGDQDEAIHIWRYQDYKVLHDATLTYRTDKDLVEFRRERNRMLDHRSNLIMMKFSFWNDPVSRRLYNEASVYELRTYTLHPGNLIEWGNLWSRGIKYRQLNNEAVCGWFEQMGNLYTVHHLWNYKDLQTRKETREAAWNHPGWDENVSYTVPLTQKIQSRILHPTPFSPLQ